MTPDQFYTAFVDPNRLDCHENPGCIRRAFNASVSASHFLDQYYEFHKRHNSRLVSGFKDIGAFVEHISNETDNAFKDIRSISNAYKHLYTDKSSKFGIHSSVDSSGSIESIEFQNDDTLQAMEEDCLSENQNEYLVIYSRKDGCRFVFLPTIDKVVDYFYDMAVKPA